MGSVFIGWVGGGARCSYLVSSRLSSAGWVAADAPGAAASGIRVALRRSLISAGTMLNGNRVMAIRFRLLGYLAGEFEPSVPETVPANVPEALPEQPPNSQIRRHGHSGNPCGTRARSARGAF